MIVDVNEIKVLIYQLEWLFYDYHLEVMSLSRSYKV